MGKQNLVINLFAADAQNIIPADEYPDLTALAPVALHIVKRYQRECREAYVSRSFGGDEELVADYIAILNYSAARAYGNTAAMLSPIAYDVWHGGHFADDTRLIFLAVQHGYYRAWMSGDKTDHMTMPEILEWCRHVGIKSHEKTLRIIVRNALADELFEEMPSKNNVSKGIGPTQTTSDMFETAAIFYAALIAKSWFHTPHLAEVNDVLQMSGDGMFADTARIAKGIIKAFKAEGIDFNGYGNPLPRFR